MTSLKVPSHPSIPFKTLGSAAHAVVFVHGFLDAGEIWGEVIDHLKTTNIETVVLDLPGMGTLRDSAGPFSLERFSSDVRSVIDALAKPFILVGHSLGSQVAELVAAERPERAAGLVLIAPVPLAGVKLPAEAVEPFRTLGGRSDQQRKVREQLTSRLDALHIDRLVAMGDLVRPPVVEALVDAWNAGHVAGESPSRFEGPVLILHGEDDPFVNAALVGMSTPRFSSAAALAVPAAGHWPHVEQPREVAARIDDFLRTINWQLAERAVQSPSSRGEESTVVTADEVEQQAWTEAFAKKSKTAFAAAFHEDVVLEATTLNTPLRGRGTIEIVMEAASKIYESLIFTHDAVHGSRHYLEWQATAFGGAQLAGVTVLTKNDAGEITHVAIHHRPLQGALRFSAELGRRLEGLIDRGYFHAP